MDDRRTQRRRMEPSRQDQLGQPTMVTLWAERSTFFRMADRILSDGGEKRSCAGSSWYQRPWRQTVGATAWNALEEMLMVKGRAKGRDLERYLKYKHYCMAFNGCLWHGIKP